MNKTITNNSIQDQLGNVRQMIWKLIEIYDAKFVNLKSMKPKYTQKY